MYEKRLRGFLQGHDRLGLPSQLVAYVSGQDSEGDFTDEAGEGEFEEEETPCALVVADLF